MPGDPDRVPKIAEFWDEAEEISSHREFRAFKGKYRGVEISALSSGIGPACMAIAVNEAARIGVEVFIRVGSCGSIQEDVECGDLVILTGAIRLDGTSDRYAPVEYPALASYEAVLALLEAAESLEVKYHVGLAATTCDFYAGQGRPVFRAGESRPSSGLVERLRKAGVLALEMEAATLFVLAGVFGLRAGAVCAVYANRLRDEFKPGAGELDCVRVANEAVRIMASWDEVKGAEKKRWLFPSLLRK